MDRDVIQELASREAGKVPGVLKFDPRVKQDRAGLKILGRLRVEPDANLAAVTQAVQDRVRSSVEHSTGWPVEDVAVTSLVSGGSRYLR